MLLFQELSLSMFGVLQSSVGWGRDKNKERTDVFCGIVEQPNQEWKRSSILGSKGLTAKLVEEAPTKPRRNEAQQQQLNRASAAGSWVAWRSSRTDLSGHRFSVAMTFCPCILLSVTKWPGRAKTANDIEGWLFRRTFHWAMYYDQEKGNYGPAIFSWSSATKVPEWNGWWVGANMICIIWLRKSLITVIQRFSCLKLERERSGENVEPREQDGGESLFSPISPSIVLRSQLNVAISELRWNKENPRTAARKQQSWAAPQEKKTLLLIISVQSILLNISLLLFWPIDSLLS